MRSAHRHCPRGRGGVTLRSARRTAPGIERGGKGIFAHSQKNRRRRSTAVGVKYNLYPRGSRDIANFHRFQGAYNIRLRFLQ